jgi:glycosyltransferase involved in cell wall biosynthesis
MKTLTVAIPTYEMYGLGHTFVRFSFEILARQTFKDFNVVVSDTSKDDKIEQVCKEFSDRLDIHYIKNTNPIVGIGININNSLKHSTGKIIKILLEDDFLRHENSLKDIVDNFDPERDHWLVTACEQSTDGTTFFRPFYPTYNNKIHLGVNTISSPSVLAIKNEGHLLFDETLIWRTDCDYYRQCFDAFGEPKILNSINVVNRIGEHQTNLKTNIPAYDEKKEKEYLYILKKYNEKDTRAPLFLRKIFQHLVNAKRYLKDNHANN